MTQPLYAINNVHDRNTTFKPQNGLEYELTERNALASNDAAKLLFRDASHKLLNISFWHLYAGLSGVRFILSGPGADALKPVALKNDLVKLVYNDRSGEHWLKITDLIYRAPNLHSEYIFLQMRDCSGKAFDNFGSRNEVNIILSRDQNIVSISLDGNIDFPQEFSWNDLLRGIIVQND